MNYNFELKTGAGESDLDFSDLNVSAIKLETGASNTKITLPRNTAVTRLEVHAGAASVVVKVPEGVAAHIRIQSGLSGVTVDSRRFTQVDSNTYQSADYALAEHKAEIFMDGGVGSFKVY